MIEQAAAQFAGCIISPTPEREAVLGRFIGEALRLRYGRLWVPRDDAKPLVGCGRCRASWATIQQQSSTSRKL
jgi:hypothetical protein